MKVGPFDIILDLASNGDQQEVVWPNGNTTNAITTYLAENPQNGEYNTNTTQPHKTTEPKKQEGFLNSQRSTL
jgi:hypothetical protein